jgi:hypothetical protein
MTWCYLSVDLACWRRLLSQIHAHTHAPPAALFVCTCVLMGPSAGGGVVVVARGELRATGLLFAFCLGAGCVGGVGLSAQWGVGRGAGAAGGRCRGSRRGLHFFLHPSTSNLTLRWFYMFIYMPNWR